jgi:cytochrome c biogenesis protein CcmG/thiol:disulfide interchange protein DsbE
MATDLSREEGDGRHRRRPRTALIIVALLAVPFVGLVAVLARSDPATTRQVRSPLVGRPSPEVRADTLDGDTFDLAELRGQWVLVNFFATWCVPCRLEHPHLIEFHERHEAIGDATVVGVIYDDSKDAVRAFFDAEGGEWPMLVDPDGSIAVRFGVAGVPESYLIAPNGVVAGKVLGGVRASELESMLAKAKAAAS